MRAGLGLAAGGRMGLRELLGAFRRRLILFFAIAGAMFLASIVASLLLTPKYTAAVSMKIDMSSRTPVDGPEAPRSAAAEQSAIDTEAAVMRSRGVAALVVDRLKLTQDSEFTSAGGVKGLLPGAARPSGSTRDAVIQNVMNNMSVDREGSTYIIDMAFTSENPRKAAAIANAFADAYLDTSLDMKLKGAQQSSRWLNDRIGKLGQEVQSADAAVANYRSNTGIVTGLGSGASVTDQQIGTITSALAMAESEAANAQSKATEARAQMSSAGIESVASVLASPVIAELRRQRTVVLNEQATASTRYGPKHPEVQRITQQLNGIDQQIKDEAARIVSGLNSEARAAQARAAAVRAQLDQLQGHQAVNSRAEVEATSLEREAEAKRTMYNQLAVTAQQVNQQQNLHEIEQKVLSRAQPPTAPSFPNKMLFAALGVILGGVLGAAGVLVAEAMDSTILSVADIEGLGLQHLASLPELTTRQLRMPRGPILPWDYVVDRPMSIFSEALRNVRSAMTLGGSRVAPKVVVITSSVPDEGKSIAAVSLARVMALSGDRILLMDCDLRKNALQDLLKGKVENGLVELLAGKAKLADVLVNDTPTGLDILPLSESLFTPKDLFGSPEMVALIKKLRASYDAIIIDAPPVLAVTDARTLSALADAVILSVRWHSTPREVVDAALVKLENEANKIIGAILTRVDPNLRANNVGYYHHYATDYYSDS